jgi:hypothetical protein
MRCETCVQSGSHINHWNTASWTEVCLRIKYPMDLVGPYMKNVFEIVFSPLELTSTFCSEWGEGAVPHILSTDR